MVGRFVYLSALSALLVGAMGCAATRPAALPSGADAPVPEYTAAPTVPPRTPTPIDAVPLPTRPKKNPRTDRLRKRGEMVGPVVTFAGISRADGYMIEPKSVDAHGVPTYLNYVGSGFQIVVEGKPGISNLEVGRRRFAYDPEDPGARPDIEIEVTRDLGDGSVRVCDKRRPDIGGIPGINPPSFRKTKKIAAALNDFACRFENFIESESSCVVTKYGDFSFVKPKESTTQFCMVVAKAWNFPLGDTLVSVRLKDSEGNPGPLARFRLRRPEHRPTPVRTVPKATPTPRRRRP